ncbi:SWIM zinc finger family protein [Oryzibacter oryziterrae]|uniref:SWIM zinc finger family protein n=1 Tax=Oryzibacter oryziterrae TaxID=2766474 RepID=UPI001F4290A6|nr:SWIM zinc finger family protein [Oryzibacter oryziterrae]
MALDLERIEALAPDQASLNAARKLLKPATWPTLACDDGGLVWGEVQGSGATPYRVVISEEDAGYKCTCPSRKFPCKHTLALMWLRAERKVDFARADRPEWVLDWLSRRRGPSAAATPVETPKGSISAALSADIAEDTPDPKAEARAQAQRERIQREREASILLGLDELDLWLQDQLDRGVAAFLTDAGAACRKLAQRLVDAKATSLAMRVDLLSSRLFALPETLRPQAAIEELGQLHLIAEAYRRQDDLDAALREDVRQTVGWNQGREALLADPTALHVAGRWHVFAARQIVQPDRLRRIETWLLRDGDGGSPRFALLLDFVPLAGGTSAAGYLVGDVFEAELVFYTTTVPLRALVGAQTQSTAPSRALPSLPDISLSAAFADYQAALAAKPWLGEWPLTFLGATVRRRASDYYLMDSPDGLALAIAPHQEASVWALAGADAFDGVGLWDGRYFWLAQAETPLGRWVGS